MNYQKLAVKHGHMGMLLFIYIKYEHWLLALETVCTITKFLIHSLTFLIKYINDSDLSLKFLLFVRIINCIFCKLFLLIATKYITK